MHMSKRELRDACNHQHAALQSLLATVEVVKPALIQIEPDRFALLEASQASARRALDAYL
jgi:hypothetical protein